jgi:hypothetical protein
VFAGGSARRVERALVQHRGIGLAGVALFGQPVAEPLGGQPVDLVLGVESVQECQADRGVEFGEQPDDSGQHVTQVCAELISNGHKVIRQILASPARTAQRHGGFGVGDQRTQVGTIGAQGVGEHVGIEAVVFVTGRAVAPAQVFDLIRGDHHDGHPGTEQAVDDGCLLVPKIIGRAVAADQPPAPPPLRKALHTIDIHIPETIDRAHLLPNAA